MDESGIERMGRPPGGGRTRIVNKLICFGGKEREMRKGNKREEGCFCDDFQCIFKFFLSGVGFVAMEV